MSHTWFLLLSARILTYFHCGLSGLHYESWRHGNCEMQALFNGHLVASRMPVGAASETGAYFILVFHPRGCSLHVTSYTKCVNL